MRKTIGSLPLFFFLFLYSTRLFSQEPIEEETTEVAIQADNLARMSGIFLIDDPTSLYNFAINDEEVEFFLDGSWKVQLDGKAIIYFGNIDPIVSTGPPVFSQEVDLTSWIFINQTWYFESTFAEKFTKNTVAAGFIGKEDNFVKHIRVGNSKIVFPSIYPYIQAGGGEAEAPGLMASFGSKSWRSDLIVRYDAATYQSLRLSGMNEVHDTYTSILQIEQGRSFILPDQGISGSVRVFVEDSNGSISDSKGMKWRELKDIEFRVFALEGALLLDNSVLGNIAVIYNGMYASGDLPGLSLRTFIDETRTWFLNLPTNSLIPPDFLPDNTTVGYEQTVADRFLLDIEGQKALCINNTAYFSPFQNLSVYTAQKGDISVVHESTGSLITYLETTEDNNLVYLSNYNMNATSKRDTHYRYPLADLDPRIYLPSFLGSKPDTDIAIRSRTYSPVSQISLGDSVIAGTITVRRNGISDSLFSFDSISGNLTLLTPPSVGENILIEWLEQNKSTKSAALTIAVGAEKKFTDSFRASIGSAFRWNISNAGYTDDISSSPGNTIVSTRLHWQANDSFHITSDAAIDINVHDTTGFYRVLGMDGSSRRLIPEKQWYRQVPLDRTIELQLQSPATSEYLSINSRVPFLHPVYQGIRVVEDIQFSGEILVMDTEFSSNDQWSAAEVLTGFEGKVDFRSTSQLQLTLKNSGSSENFKIYIQLGSPDPDLNENSGTTISIPIDTPPSDDRWYTKAIPLSDEQRAKLSASQNIRIIITPLGTATPSGRIILHSGPIQLSGTYYSVAQLPTPASLQVNEQSGGEPIASLRVFSPQLLKRFNPSGQDSLLKITYIPIETQNPNNIKTKFSRYVSPIPLSHYAKLGFFIRLSNIPTNGKLILRASIPQPNSTELETMLRTEIPATTFSANQWHYIELDLQKNEIHSNGSLLSQGFITYTRSEKEPSHIEFELTDWDSLGSPQYTIYIDEIHLFQSNTKTQVLQKNEVEWKHSGSLLSIHTTPVLSDVLIRATSSSTKDISKEPIPFYGTLETEASLWKINTKASITSSSETTRIPEQTSHEIKIPLSIFSVSEFFVIDFANSNFTRENNVSISEILPFSITTNMRYSVGTLYQKNSFQLKKNILLPVNFPSILFDSNVLLAQTWKPNTFNLENGNIDQVWKKTAHYTLSKGEQAARERSIQAHASLSVSPLLFTASSKTIYKDALLSANRSKDHGFSFSSPITIGFTTITPSWERTISSKRLVQRGGSWQSDYRDQASIPEEQKNLFFSAPFYDLFRNDIQNKLQSKEFQLMSHASTYRLQFSRASTGFLYDLWVPVKTMYFVKRNTEVTPKIENIRDQHEHGVTASFLALNSFGAFSPLHYFTWYEQDEVQQMYSWNMQTGKNYVLWDMSMIHTIIILLTDKNTISLENSFQYNSPSISKKGEKYQDKIAFAWKRDIKKSFLSMLLNSVSIPVLEGLSITNQREDKVSVSIIEIKSPLIQRTVEVDYEHSLSTGIGKNGLIRLYGGAGWLSYYPTKAEVLSIRLGISGTLSY